MDNVKREQLAAEIRKQMMQEAEEPKKESLARLVSGKESDDELKQQLKAVAEARRAKSPAILSAVDSSSRASGQKLAQGLLGERGEQFQSQLNKYNLTGSDLASIRAAALDKYAAQKEAEAADAASRAQEKQAKRDRITGYVGTALGTGAQIGAAAMMSDENTKTDVKQSKGKFVDELSKLNAKEYKYKDEFNGNKLAGKGKFEGIMAQDLEKAGPISRNMVSEDENGTKVVDYGKGFGAIVAAQVELNKKLKELEKKVK